jgi:hypothetical protein
MIEQGCCKLAQHAIRNCHKKNQLRCSDMRCPVQLLKTYDPSVSNPGLGSTPWPLLQLQRALACLKLVPFIPCCMLLLLHAQARCSVSRNFCFLFLLAEFLRIL